MPARLEELAELDASENGVDDEQGTDGTVVAGAEQLVRGWSGMSAGLSEPEGCGRKLQEGEQMR